MMTAFWLSELIFTSKMPGRLKSAFSSSQMHAEQVMPSIRSEILENSPSFVTSSLKFAAKFLTFAPLLAGFRVFLPRRS